MNVISQSLSDHTKTAPGFKLLSDNAVWTETRFMPLPGYLDTLATNYGTGINQMDFQKSPDASRAAVNDWISDQT